MLLYIIKKIRCFLCHKEKKENKVTLFIFNIPVICKYKKSIKLISDCHHKVDDGRIFYSIFGFKIYCKVENPKFKKIKNLKLKAGLEALGLIRIPVCQAPLTTINFDSTGIITTCCYNRTLSLGCYPEVSIKDAWNAPQKQKLIDAVNQYDFSYGCMGCHNQIAYQRSTVFLKKFDGYTYIGNDGKYPTNMEFEFSNLCNYECIMCGGKWSSSIRKNRENLPPLEERFGDEFVEQLDEFIPYLKLAQFLGGEPFLVPLYYKIWEKIAKLNKNLPIIVVSNCSIYNDKVQSVIDSLPNFKIIASFDSLQKPTYEAIRINGVYEKAKENLECLISQKRLEAISVCPMIQNIYEIPEIADFCMKNDINLYFNAVSNALGYGADLPSGVPEFRLSTLGQEDLLKIKAMLENLETPSKYNDQIKHTIGGVKSQVSSFISEKQYE